MTTKRPEPPVSPLDPSRTDPVAKAVRRLKGKGYERLKPKFRVPVYDWLGHLWPELGADAVACLIEVEAAAELYGRRSAYARERFPDSEQAQGELLKLVRGGRDGDVAEAFCDGWSTLPEWWTAYGGTVGYKAAATAVYHAAKDRLEARMADAARQLAIDPDRRDGSAEPIAGRGGEKDFAMPGRDPLRQLLTTYERELAVLHARRMPAMVDELPQPERDVIRLHLDGLSVSETGDRLGMTERAVKYRRERGLRMLDVVLNDYTEKVCRVDPDLNLFVGRTAWRA